MKAPRPGRRKRPYEAQYNAWVARSRYPISITYEQFVEFTKIPECHYCGASVIWTKHRLKDTIRVSYASNLDRVDGTKPYDLSNVVVCCMRCNIGKNTLFSYEEWKQIGEVIRSWGPSGRFGRIPRRRPKLSNNGGGNIAILKTGESQNGNDIHNQG